MVTVKDFFFWRKSERETEKKSEETLAADLLPSDLHRRANTMKKFTDQFFREIPKTDLHVHLDGSIRIETLVELAKEQNFELPSYASRSFLRRIT